MISFKFDAIGTSWQIDIGRDVSLKQEKELHDAIMSRIDEFDRAYSRFRNDSLVMQMAENPSVYELPEDAKAMLMLYHALYRRTDGLFSPLVGDVLRSAGYDEKYSLVPKNDIKQALLWEDTIEYNHPKIILKKKAVLDFGAAGKGYLVDLVGEVIRDFGFTDFTIDAGGDILHSGNDELRVGLEHPENEGEAIGVAVIKNQSICGSAINRRSWGDWNHVVNPKTGKPVKDIIAVWTISSSTLLADALSTCLFFVSPESLRDVYDFEYVIVKSDLSVLYSPRFTGELFVSSGKNRG